MTVMAQVEGLVNEYLDYLEININKQHNDLIRTRLLGYQEFIRNTVKKNTVLEKRFFFIVPFSPLELGIAGANTTSLQKEYIISRAKTSLYPKRDNFLS